MKKSKSAARRFASVLLLVLFAMGQETILLRPVAAAPSTGKAIAARSDSDDAVTFDNLLAADSYTLYVEARMIGHQVRSGGFAELIAPVSALFKDAPNSVMSFASFITQHSGELLRSRVMFAAMPARTSLPQALVAIEMASAEAAEEFKPELERFLVALIMPAASHGSPDGADKNKGAASQTIQPPQATSPQPFSIKCAGNLVLISDSPVTLKALNPDSSARLSDEPNFRAARARFSSEPVFIYFDIALTQRIFMEPVAPNKVSGQAESDQQVDIEVIANPSDSAIAISPPIPPEPLQEHPNVTRSATASSNKATKDRPQTRARGGSGKRAAGATKSKSEAGQKPERAVVSSGVPEDARPSQPDRAATARGPALQEAKAGADMAEAALSMLFGGAFSSLASWPEAVAVAADIEGDAFVVRALMMNSSGSKSSLIPFIPLLIPGSALTPEAAYYMPADTDIFISASLDLLQIYDSTVAMFGSLNQSASSSATGRKKTSRAPTIESQIAALEKKHRFKIRDELLAAVGNEVAIGFPQAAFEATVGSNQSPAQTNKSGVIVLISAQNKDALRAKITPALEAIGIKAANERGVIEKVGNVEITIYSKAAYAFIDNFIALAPDAASIRKTLDARLNGQTLAAAMDFHNSVRWQPRGVLAQVYVSSAIMKELFAGVKKSAEQADDETKQMIAGLNLDPAPITYAALQDALGPVHELRVPKNVITMLIAQAAVDERRARAPVNEMSVRVALRALNQAQAMYYAEHGRFASLDELGEDAAFTKPLFENAGYSLNLVVSGNQYQFTATPINYGKTGRLSFYTDESGVIREGDHGGQPATVADSPSDASLTVKNQ